MENGVPSQRESPCPRASTLMTRNRGASARAAGAQNARLIASGCSSTTASPCPAASATMVPHDRPSSVTAPGDREPSVPAPMSGREDDQLKAVTRRGVEILALLPGRPPLCPPVPVTDPPPAAEVLLDLVVLVDARDRQGGVGARVRAGAAERRRRRPVGPAEHGPRRQHLNRLKDQQLA